MPQLVSDSLDDTIIMGVGEVFKKSLGPLSIIERGPPYFEKKGYTVVFTKQMAQTEQ